jgi:hypothetical protein
MRDRTWQPAPMMRVPRVRLAVRTLMALVPVLGGGFGWVVPRAHVHRDAVAVSAPAGPIDAPSVREFLG